MGFHLSIPSRSYSIGEGFIVNIIYRFMSYSEWECKELKQSHGEISIFYSNYFIEYRVLKIFKKYSFLALHNIMNNPPKLLNNNYFFMNKTNNIIKYKLTLTRPNTIKNIWMTSVYATEISPPRRVYPSAITALMMIEIFSSRFRMT